MATVITSIVAANLTYAGQVSSTPAPTPTPCRKDVDLNPPTGPWAALSRVPVAVQAGVLLGALAIGLWLGGPVGGGLVLAVAAVMIVAVAVGWRVLTVPERLLRVAVAVLVLALALVRLFPR